jgi:pimeloyl-ACP methyl ester carboxylesterase
MRPVPWSGGQFLISLEKMPDFDNNGARIHYDLLGSGTPVLLIAGIASDGASWQPLVPHLADRHRLILIDNRGAGRSKAEGPLALEDMAGDCAALLDRLEIAKADVVGHSMGGMLGLLLAATHPDRVHRLVTMASGAVSAQKRALLNDLARLYVTTPPADWFRLLFQWLFSEPFFADERTVADAAAASAAYPFRQSPGDFARQVAAVERLQMPDLSRIIAPVLAMNAELDLMVSAKAVAALHTGVPNITHVTIANAAHSVHWEAPEAVGNAIIDFLR